MKVIYNNVNFLHISENYPRKVFSVFFDEVQHDINVEDAESRINIPIKKYEKISFQRQFARYISTGNPRRLLAHEEELYEQLEMKIKNNVVYYETGNLENYSKLIFLFAENNDYEVSLENILKDSLSEDTKLIILKDEYLQRGSNFLFRNNHESLVDMIVSLMENEMRKVEVENTVIMGARSGAQAAKVYASFFEDTHLITFNSDYKVMRSAEEFHLLQYEGIELVKSIEVTSFTKDTLEPSQLNELETIVNARNYSFEEMMKFTIFIMYSLMGKKTLIESQNLVLSEENRRFEIKNELQHRPQVVLQKVEGISVSLKVFSHGPRYFILKDDVIQDQVQSEFTFITQTELLKAKGYVDFE